MQRTARRVSCLSRMANVTAGAPRWARCWHRNALCAGGELWRDVLPYSAQERQQSGRSRRCWQAAAQGRRRRRRRPTDRQPRYRHRSGKHLLACAPLVAYACREAPGEQEAKAAPFCCTLPLTACSAATPSSSRAQVADDTAGRAAGGAVTCCAYPPSTRARHTLSGALRQRFTFRSAQTSQGCGQ